MASSDSYIIRGGIEGRERLRLLARVMRPTTMALFDSAGIASGMACLDVGCGGGDVTLDLARSVAPGGRALGLDFDEVKVELARTEAAAASVANADFHAGSATNCGHEAEFDAVYARFLLTHLTDPAAGLRSMACAAKPGGVLIVEDIDFQGSFCFPPSAAYDRYCELYTKSVQRRGADPHIGRRLPSLLLAAGCEHIEVRVVQPAGLRGEAKLATPITMQNIAEAVLADGLADEAEIAQVVQELYDFAHDERSVMSIPRVVQAWGRVPGSA